MRLNGEVLSSLKPHFPSCIKIINDILVKIWKPWNNPNHTKFNDHKKMYSMKNTVDVSHERLFIHLDSGFPCSFHNVTILYHSDFYKRWHTHFTHGDSYFEYLLGDPSYIGKNMFIMRRLGSRERPPDMDEGVLMS